jgi:hypothetical protein
LEALVIGLGELRAMRRSPGELHPALGWQVRRPSLVGEADPGVLAAFRRVETASGEPETSQMRMLVFPS